MTSMQRSTASRAYSSTHGHDSSSRETHSARTPNNSPSPQSGANIDGQKENATSISTEELYVRFASLKSPELVDLPHGSRTTLGQQQPKESNGINGKSENNKV